MTATQLRGHDRCDATPSTLLIKIASEIGGAPRCVKSSEPSKAISPISKEGHGKFSGTAHTTPGGPTGSWRRWRYDVGCSHGPPSSPAEWRPLPSLSFFSRSASVSVCLPCPRGPTRALQPRPIGMVAIIWLIFTHIAASGMGGYLAGRLRAKWHGVHTDEVYFRDTAHGFLAWAVAAVVAAALLGSATTSILGKGIDAAGATASTIATTAGAGLVQAQGQSNVMEYFSDSLFRSDHPATDSPDTSARTEVERILATSLKRGALDSADKAYLAKVIAAHTGLAESDAEKRIDATFARAKAEAAKAVEVAQEAADATRKAAAHSALWLFVALLAGAFAASYAATWGGRRRDQVAVTTRNPNPMLAPQ